MTTVQDHRTAPAAPRLDPREEHFRIAGPHPGLALFLRYLPPAVETSPGGKAVLYVHGGTFPSALSIAHRFDGRSWRDELCAAGFHVWGFDFHGFGVLSDRYPEMERPAETSPPLGVAEDASRQLEHVVRFICAHHRIDRVSLIAHSWGTIVAGRFAGRCPELVDRLVLFGAIAARPRSKDPQRLPGWRFISLQDQWDRFVADVPKGEPAVLDPRHFAEWGERYLDVDPESRDRSPAAVKTPSGAFQDIYDAWAGELAYDPARVRAPVAIIRGEWDSMCTDADAGWLFRAFRGSPLRRDIKISRATHLMHLEESRFALYREAETFLKCGDQPRRFPMTDTQARIPGYDYGTPRAARSPVTLDELRQLEATVGWTDADGAALQDAARVLSPNAEALVDHWRAQIGRQPHLAKWFFGPDGKPDEGYKAAVKKRFVQWVTDTCTRPHDQAWLDYQEEIGLRHTPAKKNKTDGVQTPDVVPLRYVLAFAVPTITAIGEFLAKGGVAPEKAEAIQHAWTKAVMLTFALWSRPYVRDGLW